MFKKENGPYGSGQLSLWKKILAIAFLVLVMAAAIILIIHFSKKTASGDLKNTATVSFGSLSSNLSSNGVIQKIATDIDVPLAVAIDDGAIENQEQDEDAYSTRNLLQMILNGGADQYVLYEVKYVNPKFADKSYSVSSSDPDEVIMTLAPVEVLFNGTDAQKQAAIIAGLTSTEALVDYLYDEGTGEAKMTVTPIADEDKAVKITTGDITDRLKDSIKHIDSFQYTLSKITAKSGDYIKIDDSVMHIAFSEWYTVFTLSEYDVSPINERMNKGEKVYASVGINALNGNKIVAEITEIKTGSNVSGVSYFSLFGRLVFPKIEKDEKDNEIGSYDYYSTDLDEKTVENLGIEPLKNVEAESLLSNYSVTITAQKTVVTDKYIVPTKCIYYDDTNKPYILVVDNENKDNRVYIEIALSTGKDAAVLPAEGYNLREGDAVRYTAEESLLSSLF